jgi:FMN phosphatase YigB (HAD superfamily)
MPTAPIPIRFLYLDVGGVVIQDFSGTNRWDRMLDRMGATGEKRTAFQRIWDTHSLDINTTYDIETMVPELRRDAGLDLPDTFCFNEQFVSLFTPNPSIMKAIGEAKKHGIRIGLLTNMYVGMYDRIMAAGLLPAVEFDPVIDSSKIGLDKPNLQIYRFADAETGVRSESILFVDNSKMNLPPARELGWRTLLYDPTRPKESTEELVALIRQYAPNL